MTSIREISGNTINNATIIQGDLNTTHTGPSDTGDSFLNKISKTDPFYDKERILELKGPFLYESFSWILDHEDFQKWRHTKKSGVLWIKGDPGKGKTMLLCGIINELEKNSGVNTNLGYFFCQATDSRINTAASVIAGLIFSLIKRHPTLLSPICKKHEDNLSQLNGPNAWTVLCDIFKDLTQESTIQDPVCIVDALDECEHDCKLLLSLIVKTSGYVKWLLSSRNVKDVERGLRSIEPNRRLSLELKENAENVSKSVDTYINKSIQDIEALEDDEELQIRTTETLRKKANGTFLWVAIVVEQLREIDHRNVEEVLEEMPEGLENLYDLIIQRANSKLRQKDREACRILLSIVTTAERPLQLKELHVFIRFQWKHYKMEYNIRDMKDIVKDIGSLLSIRDETVYFIHQSVKDYMVVNAAMSIFPKGIEYQHYTMVEASMDAMSRILKHNIYDLNDPQSYVDNVTPPSPDPLLPIAYCCVFWVEHLLRGCESNGLKNEEFFDDGGILHSFLKTNYLAWLESLTLLGKFTLQGADAIQKLTNLVTGNQVTRMANPQRAGETNCLITFIGDAYHFFHSCRHIVCYQPLQLYYSAMVFEDRHSAIYKAFHQTIHVDFENPLTVIKMPRRQFSLLRNIDLNGSYAPFQVLYSPNCSTVCAAFANGTISLYRTDTTKREIQLSLDKERRHYISLLPGSRHLISVSSTGIMKMWTIDTGAQIQQLSLNLDVSALDVKLSYRHRFGKESRKIFREEVIGLSQNGDLAASTYRTSSGSVSLVKIWMTKTAACVGEIDLLQIPNVALMHAIFSPNSMFMALIYKNNATVYSTHTGKKMKHIQEGLDEWKAFREGSKFSPNLELFALIYDDLDICFWCIKTWTMVRRIQQPDRIYGFDFSPDAATFVIASYENWVIGNTKTGQTLFNIVISDDMRMSTVLFPDWPNPSLLVSANHHNVRIWRVDPSDSPAEICSITSPLQSVTISPGSKYLATGNPEGSISIWSGTNGERVQVLKGDDSSEARPVFSPNSELIACKERDQGDILIWHIGTGKLIHLLKGLDQFRLHMAFSEDSKHLVTADFGGVRVWCMESGKCLFRSDNIIDDKLEKWVIGVVLGLTISACSTYIAVVSQPWDGDSKLWDKIPRWTCRLSYLGRRPWIFLGREAMSLIPQEFLPSYAFVSTNVAMSDSLLAYTSRTYDIIIIQVASQHRAQKLTIKALDSDDNGDASLGVDNLIVGTVDMSSDGGFDVRSAEGVSYLVKGESDPDVPKTKRLKFS
ncbi:hypothetical protein TrVFT333_007168 [Trichoderma virens FT-333]|nr:hypothetical protein TrVFT333_007168 [Trichoderma virens FT-333]